MHRRCLPRAGVGINTDVDHRRSHDVDGPALCDVDDRTAAELEPKVTDHLPAGYEPAPDEAEDTGPTDLEMAATS